MKNTELPIYEIENDLITLMKTEQVIIVEGPTGSGKTTQIPQILFKHNMNIRAKIGVTQPRRIACLSVSYKIAEDLGEEVGGTVGYKMRFYDVTGDDTKIKIMTDGSLIQEIQSDPMLLEYDVLMVDEAHDRSLNIDIILGLLKRILLQRKDFRVIISSATIQPVLFSKYFNNAPMLHVYVSPHPIEVKYLPYEHKSIDELIEYAVNLTIKILNSKDKGDILIFLTGERDIKQAILALNERVGNKAIFLPLYSRLSKEEQDLVFFDYDKPKVVIATNIAETSITIEGIKYVIDTGLQKVNEYNAKKRISTLTTQLISRADCEQRKGRTGRTGAGVCYRLYSKESFLNRPQYSTPEIKRSNLGEIILRMLSLGISDVEKFDFLTKPDSFNIKKTLELLNIVGAIDDNGVLTKIGWKMVQFPLDPPESRIILEAADNFPDVLHEVIIVTSFLSTKPPFFLPIGQEREARKAHFAFSHPYGDFLTDLNIYNQFLKSSDRELFCSNNFFDIKIMEEIENIVEQLKDIVNLLGYEIGSGGKEENIIKCMAAGLTFNICRKQKGRRYQSLTDDGIFLHPGSILRRRAPDYIVAGEIVKTSQKFARSASMIKAAWIKEISPIHADKWGIHDKKKYHSSSNEIEIAGFVLRIYGRHNKRYIPVDLKILKTIIAESKESELKKLFNFYLKVFTGHYVLFRNIQFWDAYMLLKSPDFQIKINPHFKRYEALPVDTALPTILKFLKKFIFFTLSDDKSKYLKMVTLANNDGKVFWFEPSNQPIDSLVYTLESLLLLIKQMESQNKPVPEYITGLQAKIESIVKS